MLQSVANNTPSKCCGNCSSCGAACSRLQYRARTLNPLPDAYATLLDKPLMRFVEHNTMPDWKREEYKGLLEIIKDALTKKEVELGGSGCSSKIVLDGSLMKGTALRNGDADVLITTSYEVTKRIKNKLFDAVEDDLKAHPAYTDVEMKRHRKSADLKLHLANGPYKGEVLKCDLLFEFATVGAPVSPVGDTLGDSEAAKVAVRALKVYRAEAQSLATLQSYCLEALVAHVLNHCLETAGVHTRESPSQILWLALSLFTGDGMTAQEMHNRMVGHVLFDCGSMMDRGTFMNWRVRATQLLRAMYRYAHALHSGHELPEETLMKLFRGTWNHNAAIVCGRTVVVDPDSGAKSLPDSGATSAHGDSIGGTDSSESDCEEDDLEMLLLEVLSDESSDARASDAVKKYGRSREDHPLTGLPVPRDDEGYRMLSAWTKTVLPHYVPTTGGRGDKRGDASGGYAAAAAGWSSNEPAAVLSPAQSAATTATSAAARKETISNWPPAGLEVQAQLVSQDTTSPRRLPLDAGAAPEVVAMAPLAAAALSCGSLPAETPSSGCCSSSTSPSELPLLEEDASSRIKTVTTCETEPQETLTSSSSLMLPSPQGADGMAPEADGTVPGAFDPYLDVPELPQELATKPYVAESLQVIGTEPPMPLTTGPAASKEDDGESGVLSAGLSLTNLFSAVAASTPMLNTLAAAEATKSGNVRQPVAAMTAMARSSASREVPAAKDLLPDVVPVAGWMAVDERDDANAAGELAAAESSFTHRRQHGHNVHPELTSSGRPINHILPGTRLPGKPSTLTTKPTATIPVPAAKTPPLSVPLTPTQTTPSDCMFQQQEMQRIPLSSYVGASSSSSFPSAASSRVMGSSSPITLPGYSIAARRPPALPACRLLPGSALPSTTATPTLFAPQPERHIYVPPSRPLLYGGSGPATSMPFGPTPAHSLVVASGPPGSPIEIDQETSRKLVGGHTGRVNSSARHNNNSTGNSSSTIRNAMSSSNGPVAIQQGGEHDLLGRPGITVGNSLPRNASNEPNGFNGIVSGMAEQRPPPPPVVSSRPVSPAVIANGANNSPPSSARNAALSNASSSAQGSVGALRHLDPVAGLERSPLLLLSPRVAVGSDADTGTPGASGEMAAPTTVVSSTSLTRMAVVAAPVPATAVLITCELTAEMGNVVSAAGSAAAAAAGSGEANNERSGGGGGGSGSGGVETRNTKNADSGGRGSGGSSGCGDSFSGNHFGSGSGSGGGVNRGGRLPSGGVSTEGVGMHAAVSIGVHVAITGGPSGGGEPHAIGGGGGSGGGAKMGITASATCSCSSGGGGVGSMATMQPIERSVQPVEPPLPQHQKLEARLEDLRRALLEQLLRKGQPPGPT